MKTDRRHVDSFDCDLYRLRDRAFSWGEADRRWTEIALILGEARTKVLALMHPDDRKKATEGN